MDGNKISSEGESRNNLTNLPYDPVDPLGKLISQLRVGPTRVVPKLLLVTTSLEIVIPCNFC